MTNLEFDTTLALLRAGTALADAEVLRRALRAAWHLRDRDLDQRTGLPFPHGPEHRTGNPEPGHCWLQGLLWAGLLTADDGHLQAAVNLAQALAARPPSGTGAAERLRDYAWPLYELEALLVVHADPVLARAADRLAASIQRRFDATARTFRFGEGELGGGIYFERGWLVGGLLLPALQLHLRRRPDARLQEQVTIVQQALLDRIGRGGPGLPTHWRIAAGSVFAEASQGTRRCRCVRARRCAGRGPAAAVAPRRRAVGAGRSTERRGPGPRDRADAVVALWMAVAMSRSESAISAGDRRARRACRSGRGRRAGS